MEHVSLSVHGHVCVCVCVGAHEGVRASKRILTEPFQQLK